MGNFISEPSFRRAFHSNDAFAVKNFGYDDFSVVKGAYSFYVQGFYTWHFILSGRGHLDIGGRGFELAGGDSFFIPPNTEMRYFPDADEPWEYVWFAIRGEAAAQYGEQLGFSLASPTHPCRHFTRVKHILARTIEDIRGGGGYYGVMAAFFELMELQCADRRPRTEIQAVRELIDETFTMTDFSIEGLCHDMGFSHAQLLRLFKREYGKTVQRYVIEKRLSLACRLLENTHLPIRSVAYSCGYSDEIHFMKSFKAHMGVTATQYREGVLGSLAGK